MVHDGTAVNGEDFILLTNPVFFTGEEIIGLLFVEIFDNLIVQDTRCFNLTLSDPYPNGGVVGVNATSQICIIDDDLEGKFGYTLKDWIVYVKRRMQTSF